MQISQTKSFSFRSVANALMLLATAVLLLSACVPTEQAQPQAGDIVTAVIGNLSASATASGQVQAARTASLAVARPGTVTDVYVRVGDMVAAGDALVQLDTSALALNVAAAEQTVRLRQSSLDQLNELPAEADVTAAEAAVTSAQASLDQLLAGPSATQLAIYDANVRASQASLWSASADLAGQRASVTDSQIQVAEAALLSAQLNLQRAQDTDEDNPTQQTYDALMQATQAVSSAQARLDDLRAGPDVGAAQGSVAAASARLDATEADYTLNTAAPTDVELTQSQSQLAQAEATLAELLAEPTAEDIAVAEAQLEQAQLSLADAQQALADATLTAPFDGVVTAVSASPGEYANGIVVRLADSTALEVILNVDEADIGQIAVGQEAVLTLETWPDTDIPAEVTAVAPNATTTPGSALITYEVHLQVGETDLPVRLGMTANAQLITAQRENVLLVPNQAISADRASGTYSVQLVSGDMTTAVLVTIGLRDGSYTQITSGIQEGDQLLIGDTLPVQTFGPSSN
ncbi:MAG: efflux RND transporter periplasmic adaptor subunit [Ardenticatenaceae bacterium]|nr:efflux RND transporter periplasmic adaptor subunit [Anaerolineales bacterium]MCB8920068.1 efflux RND transporter periplasmic adaptor subunit [Ardenticatenaceae bacterium]